MELVLNNWYEKFLDELTQTSTLRIISPYVKGQVVRKVQSLFNFNNFELVTRFNLRDFASNVSSLEALRFSVESGASVYGIQDLHSKVYLFDKRSAIVTSANLTSGGLVHNYECGVYLTDEKIIQDLHDYFNDLKAMAGEKLTVEECEEWRKLLSKVVVLNPELDALPDYGSSPVAVDETKSYYVKFLGWAGHRVPLDYTTKEQIEDSLCHYACCFSNTRKPRQIEEGDIIYLARMTKNPDDYAIFGKAEAVKYVDDRDQATPFEINERPWKKDWPIYLRLKNPTFIDGTMRDGVLLYDLIKALDYESFQSTKQRYERGEKDINPYKSLSQQPYVRLTTNGAEWIESRFQLALNGFGAVSEAFINSLPQQK